MRRPPADAAAIPDVRIFQLTLLIAALVCASSGDLCAQTLPAGPIRAFDGRVTISGEIVGTLGSADDDAFFNYTDYEHNALRLIRLALAAAWRPAERIALVAEIRSEDFDQLKAFGAYVRVRPFKSVPLDVQAGRIPPTFGAFGRRAYSTDQLLIGYPLAYQYLTSLRPDAIPATADDLLIMRGRGWRPSFPIGSFDDEPGVPLVTSFRWDTGVQAHWAAGAIELTGAVTNGTLSDPRFNDNNGGKQFSGRAVARPVVGLVLGASAARGSFLAEDVTRLLPEPASQKTYSQQAFGFDAEYSRDYWIVRGEIVRSRWSLPLLSPASTLDVSALGMWVEGRYRLTPRIFAAARVDHLGFSRITGMIWSSPTEWDAPVDRIEWGGGYYFQRNLVARAVVQHNRRDGGRVHERTFVSGQLSYWF